MGKERTIMQILSLYKYSHLSSIAICSIDCLYERPPGHRTLFATRTIKDRNGANETIRKYKTRTTTVT